VPKLTKKLLQYLNPQPTDRVLDLGCGDAKFTANYSDSVGEVYGVDASPSLVAAANQDYSSSRARFRVVDCRYLEKDAEAMNGKWDKMQAASFDVMGGSILLIKSSLVCQTPHCTGSCAIPQHAPTHSGHVIQL
jgi:ubiquinone/menaquinone biosynthesis C-methylase UbiE